MLVDCGKSITVTVDLTRFGIDETALSPVAAHVFYIGAHNLLQDSHAGKKGEEARAKVDAKLAAMYAGEIRVKTGRTVDTRAQRELLQAMLDVWAKDEGLSKKRAEALAKEMLAAKYSQPDEPTSEPKPVKAATKKRAA